MKRLQVAYAEAKHPHGDRSSEPEKAVRRRMRPFHEGTLTCDVIVPVFNALEDTKQCLASLAATPGRFATRVIIVNDGSDTDTTAWLRDFVKGTPAQPQMRFELIEHAKNRGYTIAVNAGLKKSDADYVVTLNSDTIVTQGWVEGLIRCMLSHPRVGIVGPLSNAASWQNVPHLYDTDGGFAINALPTGMGPQDMAELVARCSQRAYPRTTFVNGFCFMVSRRVLRKIGTLDERAFPQGYGEENDLCIRAAAAGFELAYADDVYVFHAKSKSFGSERRKELSRAGNLALRKKHGEQNFLTLVERVKDTAAMDRVRRRVGRALLIEGFASDRDPAAWFWSSDGMMSLRPLFLLPVKGGGGGAHSVIQEVTAMRRLGVDAKVAVRRTAIDRLRAQYLDIPERNELFVPFDDETVTEVAAGFDVVVATIFSSVRLLEEIVRAHPEVLPAYYVQDYEPFFFEEGSEGWTEAFESYTRVPGAIVFAKTDWLCRTIHERHGIEVHRVKASIDHAVYRPAPKQKRQGARLNVSAMIRPRTPRRGARVTMEALGALKARHGDSVEIRIFGCSKEELQTEDLPLGFAFTNLGVLTRPQVARVLGWSDLFIDMSDYQAFGRTGLEAMACGAVSAVPLRGGADEYAVDGGNAIVLDTADPDSCIAKLLAMTEDPAQLGPMQVEALQTAARYSTHVAALSELLLFARFQRARLPGALPDIIQEPASPTAV